METHMEDGICIGDNMRPSLAGLAHIEAAATSADRLETQHILLVLLDDFAKVARQVLFAHAVTRDKVTYAVRRVVERGVREERHELTAERIELCKRIGSLAPSRQAEEAFLAMIEEVELLRHRVANSGHALLGLLRVEDGIAVAALIDLGVDLNALRGGVLKLLQADNK
jgi:ATP-dependent Clp protease ATP-binding subunit ClpA